MEQWWQLTVFFVLSDDLVMEDGMTLRTLVGGKMVSFLVHLINARW